MPYTVHSTERTRRSASDAETKTLLYLMNFRNDSNEIYYFVVDFFNDVTGMDIMGRRLWDAQSKANKNVAAKQVGRELVTLFKNYCSEFEFYKYILFLGGVSSNVCIDAECKVFGIENVRPLAKDKIREGLVAEATLRRYIAEADITEEKINSFLEQILIVIDDKEPSDYVKAIICMHPNLCTDEVLLTGIFNEIRAKQSAKKEIANIEGVTIETSASVVDYCRHLTCKEIKLFVLGRLINRNPFDKGIPTPFSPIYNRFPPEKRNEMLDDCKLALSLALYDKNNNSSFWRLLDAIYQLNQLNRLFDVDDIFQQLDQGVVSACPEFDILSLKYFIAIVLEGVRA